ncbi:hypothetical protein HMPREF1980_00353, partial [Actinomyces sp. oral taxon 172 str. F0311]
EGVAGAGSSFDEAGDAWGEAGVVGVVLDEARDASGEAGEAGVVGASPEGAVTTVLSAAVASVAAAARGERVTHASAVIDAPRQWRRRMLILFMVTPRWWGMPQS